MKVVGIGGGHGLAQTLRAALAYADDVSAVVTVADDGGSSGRLTSELGIPAPGDIRNCLAALSRNDGLAALFQHRFTSGALEGHALGNLVIAALTEMHGFSAAVGEAGRIVGAQGRVHPATPAPVRLVAVADDGVVSGQVAVARSSSRIRSVHLDPPDPPADPSAVTSIEAADQVVLGPGSLFTSIIATLLVPDVRRAVAEARATKIFVCNARLQVGETESLTAPEHVAALVTHLGEGALDVVIVQSPAVDPRMAADAGEWEVGGVKLIEADVATADGGHDPQRLAAVLAKL